MCFKAIPCPPMYPSPFKSIPRLRSIRLFIKSIHKAKQNKNKSKKLSKTLTHYYSLCLPVNVENVDIMYNVFARICAPFILQFVRPHKLKLGILLDVVMTYF